MTKYYYLGIALPEVALGAEPDVTFSEFCYQMKQNLKESDWKKTRVIRLLYDIYNIRSYWLGQELDSHANLNKIELEETLIDGVRVPPFVQEFLLKYENQEDRLKYFSALVVAYFRDEIARSSGFLKKYLQMEREIRLLFVGFRAKLLGRDLFRELQFEDPSDDFVAQILAQKDTKDFEPPSGYEELKTIFSDLHTQPLKLHQALIEYKFRKIEEILGFEKFSFDRILGYMVQLIMAEKWIELDHQIGTQIVDRLVKDSA